MQIILLDITKKTTRAININGYLCSFLLFIGALIMAAIGMFFGSKFFSSTTIIDGWRLQRALSEQQQEVETIKLDAQKQLEAFTTNMGRIQSKLIRLDALGERLTELAELDKDQFTFSSGNPGVGGDESNEGEEAFSPPSFMDALNELSDKLNNKEQELEYLEEFLGQRRLNEAGYLAGYPVRYGHISSRFGKRIHPISGRISSHAGIDFAARCGTDVLAIADGIVTFSGVRGGYGNAVEISHLNGYKTFYAHNTANKVTERQKVQRGEVIALVGSTGNSTGCHSHFEVRLNDELEDPAKYISRSQKDNGEMQVLVREENI